MKSRVEVALLISALAVAVNLTPEARAAGDAIKILHSFQMQSSTLSNLDGATPYGELVLGGATLYGTAFSGGPNSNGTIYSVSTGGAGFNLLHSFKGYSGDSTVNSDGSGPYAGMVLSGNTLYGTTSLGGSAGDGTVFAMNTDGSGFNTIYSFTNGTDGVNPQGGVIISNGVLYGTTWNGGSQSGGTVFALSTNGTFKTLYNFSGGADGEESTAPLLLSNGRLYGTATSGGNGGGTVFALNIDGTGFTALHGFSGAGESGANTDGAFPIGGLALSGSTLYGTTSLGGTGSSGTIFAVNTDGSNFRTLYTFTSLIVNLGTNKDGALPEGTLTLSGDTLYGTAHDGGNFAGTIFSIKTDGSGFTTLFTFPNTSTDGYSPYAGVILSGSSLYGTAQGGGNLGVGGGTVFSLTGAGINGGTPPPPPKTVVVSATTSPAHAGTVSGAGSFSTGTSVTLTATATNDCYQFTRWTVGGKTVSSNASYTFTVAGATAAVADFAQTTYAIHTAGYPAPGGTVTGGGAKLCGSKVVLSAVAKPGFKFESWTSGGVTLGIRSPLILPATNSETITANFADDQAPKLTITSPLPNSTTTNGIQILAGKASDNVAVAAVYYQINASGTWTLAGSSSQWSNWNATITLAPGLNTVLAYAVDTSGNTNPAVSLKVTYKVPATIVPQSLSGLVATAVNTSTGETNRLSFGTSTVVSMASDTNSTSRVGNYTFTPTGSNVADLAIVYFLPDSAAGATIMATITFKTATSANFIEADGTAGTVTLAGAPANAPDSISGLTMEVSQPGSTPATNTFADSTFSSIDALGAGQGVYEYVRYSPNAGVIQEVFTDAADAGLTNYLFVDFTQPFAGNYSVEAFHYGGPFPGFGTFEVLRGSTPAETAPATLDGLAATVTPTTPAGPAWTISFGPATFGTSTFGNTNVPIGVGNYVYTRTGPTTATLLTRYVNPPPAAATPAAPISLTFSTGQKATFDSVQGSGNFTLAPAHNVAPVTLEGLTFNTKDAAGTKTTDAYGAGTFTGTGSTGSFNYSVYAPGVTMGEGILESGADAGATNFVVTSFATATSGSFFTTHYGPTGSVSTVTGTFTTAPTK